MQREYYRATADGYDGMHPFIEHTIGLRHVVVYLRALGARSVLDTGCGTGFAMRFLQDALPEIEVHGNDPSPDLLDIAVQRHGVAAERLDCVVSERLPYTDGQFDAVIESGMLHHVPEPDAVVREMLRVARQAVFISDSNMFGMGHPAARLAKLGLRRAGLLAFVNRRRRGGHDWYYNDGDGVGWDYSVFDSLRTIRAVCTDVVVIPTGQRERFTDAIPLLCSSHCLVAGFKHALGAPPVGAQRQ